MLKKFVIALALVLLPGVAAAQQHAHDAHSAHAAARKEHANFAQQLIAAKADLKLTAEQVQKLEAISVKVDEMHKKMEKEQVKADAHASHMASPEVQNLHNELMKVFTEEQLVKVHALMKADMEKEGHGKADAKAHQH